MFEAGVSGPLYEGARVQTAKGIGTVYKIAEEVTWTDGKRVRKSLVIVQLDDRPPSAMRSVFYADRVKLIFECGPDDVDESGGLAESQAEALEVERHQEAKHGDAED